MRVSGRGLRPASVCSGCVSTGAFFLWLSSKSGCQGWSCHAGVGGAVDRMKEDAVQGGGMFGLGKRKARKTDETGIADLADQEIEPRAEVFDLMEEASVAPTASPEALSAGEPTATDDAVTFNELSEASEEFDRTMEPFSEEETRATFVPAASADPAPEYAEPLVVEPHDLTVLTSAELLVGPGTRLKGDVTTCEAISVQGNLEGTIDAGRLTISETGDVDGTATLETAEIGGKFNGTLTVRGLLTIRSTGVVQGTVRYGELELERGCQVSGDVALNTDREGGSLIQLRRPARP